MAERAVRPPGEGARGKTDPAVPRDERGPRLLLQRGGRDSAARVPTAPGPGQRTGRGLTGLPKGAKLGAGMRVVAGGERAHKGDARTGGPAVPGTEGRREDPLAPVTERMRGGPAVPGTKRMRGGTGRRTVQSVPTGREGSVQGVQGTLEKNFLSDPEDSRVPEMKTEIAGVATIALPVPEDGPEPTAPRVPAGTRKTIESLVGPDEPPRRRRLPVGPRGRSQVRGTGTVAGVPGTRMMRREGGGGTTAGGGTTPHPARSGAASPNPPRRR